MIIKKVSKYLFFDILILKDENSGGMSMALTFYWYPNCGSCKKAKKWFDNHEIEYSSVHIVDETPNEAELLDLISKSELPAKKFFNTSGRVYRELNMKDKIKDASIEEMASYLASDGMLIKRPIVTDGKRVTIGFKEEVFSDTWL
jgi:arsenate reductase